jgi:phenylpropionate dioxygenase-like ring-hydroxylating dioxygenase large terminal subunit
MTASFVRPAGRDYHDPAIFARERELIFGRSWIPVAREEDLTSPGDYVTIDIAGDPVVVTRGSDGVLHALANVCRHRNAKIVGGTGRTPNLRCPYHRWTYRLDGRLAAAPQMETTAGFDAVSICLPRFRVETWFGWVFVNLDPDAAPLAPQLRGLDALYAGHRVGEMRRVATLHQHLDCNWKIAVENFSESYHHAAVHAATLQPAFPGERSWAEDNRGEPWLSIDHVSVQPRLEPFTATVVFPLHTFSIIRPDGVDWMRFEVHDVDDIDVQYQYFTLPEAAPDAAELERYLNVVRAINDEDNAINRRTAAGTRSRFAVPGPTSLLELGIRQFRRWWCERMAIH